MLKCHHKRDGIHKISLYSIFLFLVVSLRGMEQKDIVQESGCLSYTSLLCSAEIRLILIDSLLKVASFKEAFESFKALSLTDKTAVQLLEQFKTTQESLSFIEHLDNFSREISDTFTLSEETIGMLKPLLNERVFNIYRKIMHSKYSLSKIRKAYRDKQSWNKILEKLRILNTPTYSSIGKVLFGSHFDGFYDPAHTFEYPNSFWEELISKKQPIKKDICVRALEQHAPSCVIESILSYGVRYEKFHPDSLSPFFLAFHRFLCIDNTPASEEERTDLQKILDMLLAAGASIDQGSSFHDAQSGYFYSERPLSEAIKTQNVQAFCYLYSKGASVFPEDIRSLVDKALGCYWYCAQEMLQFLINRFSPGEINDVIELIIRDSCLLCVLENTKREDMRIIKKRSVELLSMILPFYQTNSEIERFAFTFLEYALGYNNRRVAQLLSNHGAKAPTNTGICRARQLKYIYFLNELYAFEATEELYKKEYRFFLEKIGKLLKEIRKSVSSDTPSLKLLFSGIDISLHTIGIEEAIDFLLFLKDHKELSFDCPGYGSISSFLHLINGFVYSDYSTEEEVQEREKRACKALVLLVDKETKDTPNREGKTAVQKALECRMLSLFCCLRECLEGKKFENKRSGVCDFLKKLINQQDHLVAIRPYVNLLFEDLFSEETKDMFKYIALREPFPFTSLSYGDIPSVFHFIAAYILIHPSISSEACFLVQSLIKEGLKDERLSNGKTAAQRAKELGFNDFAESITTALDGGK